MKQCSFCIERQQTRLTQLDFHGKSLSSDEMARYLASFQTPACAKTCPTGALRFSERDELLAEARRRIAKAPGRYVDHIYGEKELGGLGWLYLSSVPFRQLGFPTRFVSRANFQDLGFRNLGFRGVGRRGRAPRPLHALWTVVGTMTASICWFFQRRDDVRRPRSKEE